MRAPMATKLIVLLRKGWQTLGAIKTGVVLLITVGLVSAADTLILQRPMTDPDEMSRAYSPQVLLLRDAVGLTNVFHAWWFVAFFFLVIGRPPRSTLFPTRRRPGATAAAS